MFRLLSQVLQGSFRCSIAGVPEYLLEFENSVKKLLMEPQCQRIYNYRGIYGFQMRSP